MMLMISWFQWYITFLDNVHHKNYFQQKVSMVLWSVTPPASWLIVLSSGGGARRSRLAPSLSSVVGNMSQWEHARSSSAKTSAHHCNSTHHLCWGHCANRHQKNFHLGQFTDYCVPTKVLYKIWIDHRYILRFLCNYLVNNRYSSS